MAVLKDKHRNKLTEEFMNAIMSSEADEIKRNIVMAEGQINGIETAKENDQELESLREKVKEISAPYRESKAIETSKIKYCLYVLEERGVNIERG